MRGEPRELRISTGACQEPGVAFRNRPLPFALECPGYDSRPAALGTGIDHPIDEVDKLIRKPHRDLLAHPKMVPNR